MFGAAILAAVMLTGCGGSRDNFVVTNGLNGAAPPAAVNDTFNALGNATVSYSAANGVLANDAVNGGQISAFDATGSNGGTVVVNNDGSFTYTPVFGFVGSETFTYTLTNSLGASTATVTLTSTGEGFFVNNQAANGGNGSQATPFNTLAAAIAAAGTGDTIFVSRGDGTNTGLSGAVTLPAGVNLIGEGQGLILSQTVVPQGQAPVLTGPITCGGNNTISGLILDGSASTGVIVNGVSNVNVTNNTFRNSATNYVSGTDAVGTITVSSNTFEASAGGYVNVLNSSGTTATVTMENNTFTNTGVAGPANAFVDVGTTGSAMMAFTARGNTINSPSATATSDIGISGVSRDTSTLTVTIDNNTVDGTGSNGLFFDANDTSNLNGTVSGNMLSNCGGNGLFMVANDGTTTISGNVVNTTTLNGLDIDFSEGGIFVVSNNNISNTGGDGIDYFDLTTIDPAKLAIRNNMVSNAGANALLVEIQSSASVCVDVTGNTVDDDMEFLDNSTGSISVEEFATLTTLNTFTAGAPTQPSQAVVPVADGFCAIP